MKKLLLTLAAVALGASAAMADTLCEVSFGKNGNTSAPNTSNYQNTTTYTGKEGTDIANKTFTVVDFNNNNNGWTMIKCGRKSTDATGSVATDFAIDGYVETVEVSFEKINSNNVTSVNLYTSENGEDWGAAIASNTSVTTSTTLVTFTVPEAVTGNYYKVDFVCTGASANGVVWLSGIKYNGTPLSGDLKPSGLSFAETSFSVLQGEAFTAPTLVNPNNLAVTWSSSNTEVATVAADGTVTLEGEPGVTTILAEWAGDDSFAKGSASYTLEVVASAKNINDMISSCVNSGDKIYINFPMTVVYVSGQYCYVIDSSYNATLIYQTNSYAIGDVIPAGWTATYSPYNGLPEFKMSATPESTEMNEVFYESVYSIGKVDVNKVLVLKGVTFATATLADATDNFNGTLSDESTVTFRNQFRIASVEAGTYDVTCAVALYNGTLQVYPIEYAEASNDPELPATYSAEVSKGNVSVSNNDYEINVSVKTSVDEVTVTLPVPEGWDSWYYMDYGTYSTRAAYEPAWFPESVVTAQGYAKGNTFVVPVDKAEATEYSYSVMLGKGGMVDANSMMDLNIKVQYDATVGVSAIEAEGVAEYYNLQGLKVVEPKNGIFVKVVNGKATKVVK